MPQLVSESSVLQVATQPFEAETDEIIISRGTGAIQILTELIRRKWLIALVTGIVTIAGAGISFILPVRFTATTRLLTPQPTQPSTTLMMSQPINSSAASLLNATGGGLGLRNPNDLYVGLLHSRPVADAIISQFRLMDVYRRKSSEKTRKRLAEVTSISSEKSGFIVISVTDRDKVRAAQLANAYPEQLRALTKSVALTEASRRRLFYEEELQRATDSLISAELSLSQIENKKGLVQLDAQAKALIEGIAQLRAQVAAKEVELRALRSYSTENNPDVKMAQNQLSSLREQLTLLEHRSPSSTSFSSIGLQDVAGSGVDYLRAEHELQYRQSLLDLLMKQYDAAKLDEAKDAAIIQVVETATPPEERSFPRRLWVVLLALALGLAGSCGFVYVSSRVKVSPELRQSLAEFQSVVMGRSVGR